jgi:hypothetical protein
VSTGDSLQSATLWLGSEGNGYAVSNIVPLDPKVGKLSYREYNEILQDFEFQMAAHAAVKAGFTVERTTPKESLDHWASPNTAEALRTFSRMANKSTGSSHPLDKERWYKFIIAAHGDQHLKLGTHKLARWLFEVEGWRDEKASELVIEFEFGLSLLREYDKSGS